MTDKTIIIEVDEAIANIADQTFLFKAESSPYLELVKSLTTEKDPGATVDLKVVTMPPAPCSLQGRAQICYCFGKEYVSATIRRKKFSPNGDTDSNSSEIIKYKPASPMVDPPALYASWKDKDASGYYDGHKRSDKFPIPINAICSMIHEQIFADNTQETQGLILISGATSSGKSKIATGIILKHLETSQPDERPHLISIEDTLEDQFAGSPEQAIKWGVSYTPRIRATGQETLRGMLNDALRQKPAVVYMGEVRDDEDWPEILKFASTGHLVVATTHSGSLRGLMAKLVGCYEEKTPAQRGELSGRIAALIHLRSFTPELPVDKAKGKDKIDLILPSFWIGNPQNRAAFVRDGLGSILPYNTDPCKGMAGRLWCLKTIRERSEEEEYGPKPALSIADVRYQVALKQAITWDIEGK